jgi:hypothetical protein
MKNLAIIIVLLFNSVAFSQDTLSKIEWIKGKEVLVKEIIQEPSFYGYAAKAISILLAVIATFIFIFYKPKNKNHA